MPKRAFKAHWTNPVIADLSDGTWRPIDGWPYHVSADGRVARSSPSENTQVGRVLRPNHVSKSRGGYIYYVLCQGGKPCTFYAHVLVANAFLGAKQGEDQQVRHLDGNPLNNHHTNLAWGSAKENASDRAQHGKTAKGERAGLAILTNAQAAAVRLEYTTHLSERVAQGFQRAKRGFVESLARRHNLNLNTLSSILSGKGYHVN